MQKEFQPRHMANLLWAWARVQLASDETAERLVLARAAELKAAELANLSWSLATRSQRKHLLRAAEAFQRCMEEADSQSLLAVAWALHHAGLHLRLDQLRHQLLQQGRAMDEQGMATAALPLPKSPRIPLDLSDRLVLSKPPGWEVEPNDSNSSLSEFLGGHPIFQDKAYGYGFLHRLDVPGSGLVIAAKSYQAYLDLQLQLSRGQILREYLVLCHGWMARGGWIGHPLLPAPHGSPGPSRVTPRGRRALSGVKPVARGVKETARPSPWLPCESSRVGRIRFEPTRR
ncbi:unnamed protein product [Effrenium voratum]|nr:unnamed protein product [Effrenium voratum]